MSRLQTANSSPNLTKILSCGVSVNLQWFFFPLAYLIFSVAGGLNLCAMLSLSNNFGGQGMFLKSKAKQKAHKGVGRGKYMPFLEWQITGVSCITLQLFRSHRLWTQLYEVFWVLIEIMEITIFLSPSGKISPLAKEDNPSGTCLPFLFPAKETGI